MGNAISAILVTYIIYEYLPPEIQPSFTQILSYNSMCILSLYDIVTDVLLCFSIFQNVGPATWLPWISIFAIVCGLVLESLMTCIQFGMFVKGDKLT